MVSYSAMDSGPVGLFDSGVGGLSVVRQLSRLAPQERLLYFADTLWFPYGGRPAPELRKRAFAITRRLIDGGARLIVVACNTASAAALDDLRQAFPVPFVGMVPGIKPAAELSRSGHVIILATPGTLGGDLYQRVAGEHGRHVRVTEIVGTGLAEAVEHGDLGSAELRDRLHAFLDRPVAEGADTVVLGCTHYGFLAGTLRAEFPAVSIVDTAEAVARRTLAVLDELSLAASPASTGGLSVIVSGDRTAFFQRMIDLGFAPAEGVLA